MRRNNNSRKKRDHLIAKKIRRLQQYQNDIEVQQIFFGKDNEPITDILIEELCQKGFLRNDLLHMKEGGYLYCRPRNSFLSPPIFEI